MDDIRDRRDRTTHDCLERLSHRFPGLCAGDAEHYLRTGDAIGRSLRAIMQLIMNLRLWLMDRLRRPASLGDSGSDMTP